jgi:hypothetical protein
MNLELARHQWEDGHLRVEEARHDRRRYLALMKQVDTLVAALRGRVGQSFSLADLAKAYDGADDWAQSVLAESDPEAPVPLEAGTVADAAFHAYARAAADYRP